MSERLPVAANPFSGAVIGLIIAIGLISFTAIFVLLGWSPDLANKDRAGDHPYSTSALGYQGLVRLLTADGQEVEISRLAERRAYSDGLLVMTVPRFGFGRVDDFDPMAISEPALFVLPKWRGRADRTNRNWHVDTDLLDRTQVARLLNTFDKDADIWRLRNPGMMETPFGAMSPDFEHEMQVIDSDSLTPVIRTPGGTLLARVPGSQIYILSDPDVINTFGVARRENARFALGLIAWLTPYEDAPVTLDATLHGFERSGSLLKVIFDIPYLGATLLAFATMLLIGWAASVRVSQPQREERAIAFGKQALAENSAGLIAMARRESAMAPRYRDASDRAIIRALGLPRGTDTATLARALDMMAKQRDSKGRYSDTAAPLDTPARNREDLTDKARRLWRWRKEITNAD